MIRQMLLAILLMTVMPQAFGQCMRLVETHPKLPGPDGPGAFGPLHVTLTLDCLRFLRTESTKSGLVAIVEDEKGKSYRVSPGWYMGENDGRVSKIEPEKITLVQLVKDANNEWMEVTRYLFRHWDLSHALSEEAAAKLARKAFVAAGHDGARYRLNEGIHMPPQPEYPEWEFVFECNVDPAPADCETHVRVNAISGRTRILPSR